MLPPRRWSSVGDDRPLPHVQVNLDRIVMTNGVTAQETARAMELAEQRAARSDSRLSREISSLASLGMRVERTMGVEPAPVPPLTVDSEIDVSRRTVNFRIEFRMPEEAFAQDPTAKARYDAAFGPRSPLSVAQKLRLLADLSESDRAVNVSAPPSPPTPPRPKGRKIDL